MGGRLLEITPFVKVEEDLRENIRFFVRSH